MAASFDLAVIGGGVVGGAAAQRAAANGASVVLFDRRDAGRATDAGAGIVGPALNTRDRAPWLELAAASALAYPSLIEELGATSGDTGYSRVGLLAVAIGDDEVARFRSFADFVHERFGRQGHPTGHEVRELDPDEARRLYPVLGDVTAAVFDTGAARVDGRRLGEALLTAARKGGVEVRDTSATSIETMLQEAQTVLIAGGAWSPRFGEELGLAIPVEPQRGQIAHLGVPAEFGDTSAWPMLSQLGDQYQVAWPDGRVAVGATRETGSGFAVQTTAGGVRSVLDEAIRVSPGLSGAELLEVRVGLRPVTPDLMPAIGRAPGRNDVVIATGHGPTGLTCGPFSGRLAADLALGLAAEHDLAPFAVDRSFAPEE